MLKYISALLLFGLFSCSDNELLIPKPSTFLRTDLPAHTYDKLKENLPYTFELSNVYFAKPVLFRNEKTNHLEINLGKLNGVLYLNYYPIPNRDSLVRYINLSNDKVDEHQIKATGIKDKQLIFNNKRVFGTFFMFKGNVATNYQFYLTDSVHHFIRGEVLMNCRPNYDSLKPSLNYIQQDLEHLFETFEWKK